MSVINIAQKRLDVVSRQLCSTSAAGRQLEGQVAIVTGAGKGIGEATAELLSSQGASVFVCDIDARAALAVSDKIKSQGGRAVAVTVDITSPEAAVVIIEAALSLGGIDIIVNNAGFTWDGVIHKITPQQWQLMLEVHVTAPFRLVQAAAPYVREAAKKEIEQEGKARPRNIINISSTTGTHGNAGQANYATAKAGVVGLTKSIAKEWGPLNVRCNALAFGLIDTRLTRPKEDGETIHVAGQAVPLGIPGANQYWSAVKGSIPLQRSGTVQDAAGAVMMLVSPWANYITGQVIEVNGGAFM